MPRLYINGGKKLYGSVKIHGSKNGVLPILASAVAVGQKCIIRNCPDISDVSVSLKILKELGCECSFENGTVTVDASALSGFTIPKSLMCEMRSSVIYLGALLSRMNVAVISDPGGCDLGPRPIDLHISSLEKLGAEFSADGNNIYCKADELCGTHISLPFVSVGATENIILSCIKAQGKTVIENAACEPEIIDLANFLNKCGAQIHGAGSKRITVYGVKKLHGAEYTVMPDRIEACTYLSAFAATGGSGELCGVLPLTFRSFTDVLRCMGCNISTTENTVKIFSPERLKSFGKLSSGVYPDFPTDAGPLAFMLASLADGKSEFTETVFPQRFAYINEMRKLGVKTVLSKNTAEIYGKKHLRSAKLSCTDLRAGAALIIGSLAAAGESEISKIEYIDRGYENIEKNLSALGADIKRI